MDPIELDNKEPITENHDHIEETDETLKQPIETTPNIDQTTQSLNNLLITPISKLQSINMERSKTLSLLEKEYSKTNKLLTSFLSGTIDLNIINKQKQKDLIVFERDQRKYYTDALDFIKDKVIAQKVEHHGKLCKVQLSYEEKIKQLQDYNLNLINENQQLHSKLEECLFVMKQALDADDDDENQD